MLGLADVLGFVLLAQATFGVADPAQRFAPVPAPLASSDPCNDAGPVGRWVQMSADGAPKSLHDQGWLDSTALWTGSRLAIASRRDGKWGGAAFDPCRNAWSPIPESREMPRIDSWLTADHDRPFQPSYDGSFDAFDRMAVWDASQKRWVGLAATHPPVLRTHYAVALTDQQFLVWGGWTRESGLLGDGAVLDLAHPRWKVMSPVGAPSPRVDPTAVAWTGSRFLVWGGRRPGAAPAASAGKAPAGKPSPRSTASTASTILGDGAQYDPRADRWTAMAVVRAPSPRTNATVAWTGRKLVLVGGETHAQGTPLRDGGIYDPATNRWKRLEPPPGDVRLPTANVGPLTRILIAPDGRVVFLPDGHDEIVILDADSAHWSTLAAEELGKRHGFRAFLAGRRLMVWGGATVLAEHRCPPPVPGQPICDSFAETARHDDGWMVVLAE